MMIAAVIAEYNPFHNGHAYQLKEIRRQTGADLILVMMSGDFVQRGAPSCVDKYARCRMALAAGADMVCELPVYGAIGSAEIFAESAVSLLNRLGCIDYLCFGAETIAPSLFDAIIPILSDEPDEYKAFLQAGLKTGMNFPAARSRALYSILGDAQCSDILNQPNNILAIEYMKALYKSGSTIRPFPIRRSGAGYHSTDTDVGFCSATAIRRQLSKNLFSPETVIRALDIPDTSKAILQDYLADYPVLTRNDFSDILAAHLLDTRTSLTDYTDITRILPTVLTVSDYSFYPWNNLDTFVCQKPYRHPYWQMPFSYYSGAQKKSSGYMESTPICRLFACSRFQKIFRTPMESHRPDFQRLHDHPDF